LLQQSFRVKINIERTAECPYMCVGIYFL